MKLTATHPLRGRVTVKTFNKKQDTVLYEYDFADKAINHGIGKMSELVDWDIEDD